MLPNKNRNANNGANNDDVVKTGYLKKLKTMKKKFFVLRRETGPDSPARLEYYDNERKFNSGIPPKKPIVLRTCFSINRKKDPKHNHVLALYTSPDSVNVAADSEAELNDWLGFLHHHMHQAGTGQDGHARKMYKHVWPVAVQPRSLGSSKGLTGEHRICLTYKSIALVRVGDCQKKIEFPLNSIRRCGHTGSFFFLGLGRSAATGAGDIWMLTEDAVIAENMHSIIRKALHEPCNSVGEDPVSRERTKSMTNHRSMDAGGGGGGVMCPMRDRCGSMPSRSRTSSEGSVQSNPNKQPGSHHNCSHHNHLDGATTRGFPTTSASMCLNVTRPQSIPSSSESMESAASGDDIDGMHPDTPENMADGLYGEEDSYIPMNPMSSESNRLPHPPFTLPIISTQSYQSSQSKGLISPVSIGSSSDGPPYLSSPQDHYMPMASPSEWAGGGGRSLEIGGYVPMERSNPLGHPSDTSGYLTMAPLNSPGSLLPAWPANSSSQVSSSSSHSTHSRFSSQVDESSDNYLSMVPGSSGSEGVDLMGRGRAEGYLDMTPTPALPTPIPHSPSDGDSLPEMSPGSSCSFTSGTPSSDHRFPDFIAEKGGGGGGSYYGCSEDDDSSLDRPIRTNSVGSKPELFRSRKNSAPILGSSPISNSWSGTPGTFFRGFLQARSQERNDDLMEFDFSKNKSCDSISADKEKKSSSFESIKRTLRHRTSSKSSGNGKSFVFDSMKRDKKKSESELSNKSLEFSEMGRYYEVEINPSPRRKTSESYEGYLPMKPTIATIQSLTGTSDYLDMSNRDSFSRQNPFTSPYMDMSRTGGDRLGGSSCSVGSNEGYVDMSEGKGLGPLPINHSAAVPSSSSQSSSSFPNGAKVRKFSPTFSVLSSHDDQYMSIDLRSSGVDVSSPAPEGDKYNKKKEKKSMRRRSLKDPSRRKKSEPISVIGRSSEEGGHEISKKGMSPRSSLSLSTLLGRNKSSSNTPSQKTPPQKTPLSPTGSPLPKSSRGTPSPFSSLTRNKNRDDKDSRKDSVSKDSGMTSSLSSLGTGCIEEASREAEESAMSAILGDTKSITQPSQVPNDSASKQTQSSGNKRTSGIFEPPPAGSKQEESQAGVEIVNQGTSCTSHQQGDGDHGAYVNLTRASCEKSAPAEKQRKLSSVSASDYMNISPIGSCKSSDGEGSQPRDYVNMCPGGRQESTHMTTLLTNPQPSLSPRLPSPSGMGSSRQDCGDKGNSQQEKETSSPSSSKQDSGHGTPRQQKCRDSRRLSSHGDVEAGGEEESTYLLMTPGQPSPKPLSPQTVARRPNIPPSLLSTPMDPIPPDPTNTSPNPTDPTLTATLERLNLGGSNSNERCRSHSGPGAPEGSAVGGEGRVKKQLSEPRVGGGGQGGNGRAASACSSPVSYSPPTSPTLGGSVSSVSSLSEGGLSSASSTCTVVNMGVARREGGQGGPCRPQEPSAETAAHSTVASALNQLPANTSSGSGGCSSGGDSSLNYVFLDLGPAKTPGIRSSPHPNRRSTSTPPITAATTSTTATTVAAPQDSADEDDDEPLSYAQIDFTKSEGLRTTSLSRDHRH